MPRNPLQAPTKTASEIKTALDHGVFQWVILLHMIGGESGGLQGTRMASSSDVDGGAETKTHGVTSLLEKKCTEGEKLEKGITIA